MGHENVHIELTKQLLFNADCVQMHARMSRESIRHVARGRLLIGYENMDMDHMKHLVLNAN